MFNPALRLVFAALVIGSTAFAFVTSGQLPDPVAVKFDFAGNAIAYMARATYRAFMTAATPVLPLILLVLQVWLPRVQPLRVNIPNREYWLAPERRMEMFAYFERHALIVGSGSALFFAAMHRLMVHANSQVPPHLDNFIFFLTIGTFVLGVILAIIALALHFRRAP